MAEIKRRVYSPRGQRGGGGLVAQITIDEADVQRWLGPVGAPSATERVSVVRGVGAAFFHLTRDLVAALEGFEAERTRAEREGAAGEGVGNDVERRQPGDFAGEGSGASPEAALPGVDTQPAGLTTQKGPIPTEHITT